MADRKGLAQAAKLVRRTTLDNKPSLIVEVGATIDSQGWSQAVDSLLDRPLSSQPIYRSDLEYYQAYKESIASWFDLVDTSTNPVQEKMAFFWSTILCCSYSVTGKAFHIFPQHVDMLRSNALGNYRDLLQAFVMDPLLMRYLSAQSNRASNPNENLARELMELFTFGVGNYSEQDVRNAALAMSGWQLDDNSVPTYNPKRGHTGALEFLGETKEWDVASITNKLLDDPRTAKRISSLVWKEFLGESTPVPENLGDQWLQQGYDIKWLIKAILSSQQFVESNHYVRPRSGMEYYLNLKRVLRYPSEDEWRVARLGQRPWHPPNVAGWPDASQWLDVGSMLGRTEQATANYSELEGGSTASIEEVLDRCGVYDVSDSTMQVLNSIPNRPDVNSEDRIVQLRWWLTMMSPEVNLT